MTDELYENFVDTLQKLSDELEQCFVKFIKQECVKNRDSLETAYLLNLTQSAFISSMNNLMRAAARSSDNPDKIEKVEMFQHKLIEFLSSQMKEVVIMQGKNNE